MRYADLHNPAIWIIQLLLVLMIAGMQSHLSQAADRDDIDEPVTTREKPPIENATDGNLKKGSLFVTQTLADDKDGVLVRNYGVGEEFYSRDGNKVTWTYEELRASAWHEQHDGRALHLGYRFTEDSALEEVAISVFDLDRSYLWNVNLNLALIDRYVEARVSSGEFLWWKVLRKNEYEMRFQASYKQIDISAVQQRIFVSDDNIIDDFGVSLSHDLKQSGGMHVGATMAYHGRCARFNSQYYWSPEHCEEIVAPGLEIGVEKGNYQFTMSFRHELGVNGHTGDSNSYGVTYEKSWSERIFLNFIYLRGDSYRSESPYWWEYVSLRFDILW